jgi:type VI secretion system protein ImpM
MQCGAFGKLPTKRDFIAINAPRGFLDVWERWMQSALSASRQALAQDWQQAFLSAPIWRFWLGADVCESTVIGAFMPSLDAVGRYFPLTVFAVADRGDIIAPPDLASQENWFEDVEHLLLSALAKNTPYDGFLAALTTLSHPRDWKELFTPDPDVARVSDGSVLLSFSEGLSQPHFNELRLHDPAALSSSSTYWWTLGGEGYPQFLIARRHMPDAYLFGPMLNGKFTAETV